MNDDNVTVDKETQGTSGKVILILAFAWATLALGGYYLMIRSVV